jgi:transketolase
MPGFSNEEMKLIARRIRGKVIEMSFQTGAAHLGSCLSCIDILVAAYFGALALDPANPDNPLRDRFLLSKGHAAAALYATLFHRGFINKETMDSFGQPGGCLAEHPGPACAPGIENASGSLGHGLSLGLGMALAARIRNEKYKICVLMSDGECNEGSVWEAAMFAASQKLDRVIAVVDFNRWQATGRTEEIMSIQPLKEKWESFGWSAHKIDGHDIAALSEAMKKVPDGTGKPVVLIASTVKGKGVSFMEDDNNWHYRVPNEKELVAAFQELELK